MLSILGRGFQQKLGAEYASGDILLFVHADTKLPNHYDDAILKCLHTPGNIAGFFRFSLDSLECPERYFSRVFMLFATKKHLKVKLVCNYK